MWFFVQNLPKNIQIYVKIENYPTRKYLEYLNLLYVKFYLIRYSFCKNKTYLFENSKCLDIILVFRNNNFLKTTRYFKMIYWNTEGHIIQSLNYFFFQARTQIIEKQQKVSTILNLDFKCFLSIRNQYFEAHLPFFLTKIFQKEILNFWIFKQIILFFGIRFTMF